MSNPVTAYVGSGPGRGGRTPLYFAAEEGGLWERYDGRPYEQCAALAFEHNDEMIVLDFVLWRRLVDGKPSAHPVRVFPKPVQGLP